MLINSTWKVQLAGVVLLDFTDFITAEPKLDRVFVTDRVIAIGAASVRNVGRQNISHTASFSRVRVFNDDSAARTYMRTHSEALPAVEEYCEIEWLNQFAGDTLQSCVITGYDAHVEGNWFTAGYTLSSGAILPNQNIIPLFTGFTNISGATTPFLGVLVIFPSGIGAISQDIILQTGTNTGDLRDVFVEIPTTGPTLRVRDINNAGTILWTANTAGSFYARFSWNGSHWTRVI
jgi:hypothetical protein